MASTMPLKVRMLDGEVTEHQVDPSEYIYSVAQRLADSKKPGQKVFARLVHEGRVLPPGSKVGDCGLGEVIDAVWCTWKPPTSYSNSSKEVLPRREPTDDLWNEEGHLNISGMYAREGFNRDQLASSLPAHLPSLRILDIRQCGFAPKSLVKIFEKLCPSLEELWASRNHFNLSVLQCLQQKALQLRVVDVGYSECEHFEPLPDLVCEKTEQLILGDLGEMDAKTFTSTLSKCPSLRSLDINNNYNLTRQKRGTPGAAPDAFLAIAQLSELRSLEARRLKVSEGALNEVLSCCCHLEHLYLDEISSSSTIRLLKKLDNLKVLYCEVQTEDLGNQLICEICHLNVETLVICPAGNEDEEDAPNVLNENVGPVVEALKTCVAGCIAIEAASVAPAVFEAVGSRLCELDSGMYNGTCSLISSLLEIKHCCTNLLSLSVNYWEQIDGKQLALLAAACPLLQEVRLNADDADFQTNPIDQGILGLGQHCHQLEALDMYDRILEEPAETVMAATAGWPRLRYLCMAGCNRKEWSEVEGMSKLPQVLATNCPKLQEFVIYNDEMRTLIEPVLIRECPLFGELLSFDSDSDGR